MKEHKGRKEVKCLEVTKRRKEKLEESEAESGKSEEVCEGKRLAVC